MYPQPPTVSLASTLPEGRAGIPEYPTYLLTEDKPRSPSGSLRQRLGDFLVRAGLKLKGLSASDQNALSTP